MTEKCVIVTGAARGIGLASADLFREEGWKVVIVDRDRGALDEVAAARPDLLALPHDVSDPDQVAAMLRDTRKCNVSLQVQPFRRTLRLPTK